jgi:lysozyme family protein
MADIKLLVPKIAKWEGGFVNDPADAGGATNMGVTLSTWRQVGYDKDGDGDIDVDDIRKLTAEDFEIVLKLYWDRWRANEIKNQSLANILVDWVWGSGKWGIVIPQRIIGVPADGVVGPKTIEALNRIGANSLFYQIFTQRVKFLNSIVEKSVAKYEAEHGGVASTEEKMQHTNLRFKKGWMNRLNDFKFEP